MQFLISPGGSIWNSSLKRPELPPSSVTVTTAVSVSIHGNLSSPAAGSGGENALSPASSVERPVPPPIDTILMPELALRDIWTLTLLARYWSLLIEFEVETGNPQKLSITSERCEVGIMSGVRAVNGINCNSLSQCFHRFCVMAFACIGSSQRVQEMVGPGLSLESLLEDIYGRLHVPTVELEYSLVVQRIWIASLGGSADHLLLADCKISADWSGYVSLVAVVLNDLLKRHFGSS